MMYPPLRPCITCDMCDMFDDVFCCSEMQRREYALDEVIVAYRRIQNPAGAPPIWCPARKRYEGTE